MEIRGGAMKIKGTFKDFVSAGMTGEFDGFTITLEIEPPEDARCWDCGFNLENEGFCKLVKKKNFSEEEGYVKVCEAPRYD